jgi:AraC-like DNA-binding protein
VLLKQLELRLGDCKTFQQRVSVANHFFAERLKQAQAVDRIGLAADWILSSSGKLSSADLAAQAGIGVRQFQREFSASFGASPKLFSRIVLTTNVEVVMLGFQTNARRTSALVTEWSQ